MNGYAFENHGSKILRVGLAMQQGIVANLKKSKTIQYSGSLLFYPWVRVEGEMTCVSTDDALQLCLKNLQSPCRDNAESTTDAISSDGTRSDASTMIEFDD